MRTGESPARAATRLSSSGARWPDQLAAAAIWSVAVIVCLVFAWIIGDLLRHGLPHLSWQFLLEAPRDAGRAGGIGPILVSTLSILAICLLVVLPLGVATALFLSEFNRHNPRFGRVVRVSLDVLAGVPSIVFGLFGNAFFSLYLGMGFSILSGGLTLACMALPLLIRSTEAGLRAVPDEYRSAAIALGIPSSATIWRVILPAATPGLVVGLLLSIGRALAETAALLFTSGYVDRMPESVFDSGRALSVHVYDLAMNVPGGEGPAYATGVVLVGLLLVINAATFWIADFWLHRRVMRA